MDPADLLDLDPASASKFFNSSMSSFKPPSPSLAPPSLQQPSLYHLGFNLSTPQPPIWIFDDRPSVISENFDSEKCSNNLQNEKIRSIPILSINEFFHSSVVIKKRLMQALEFFKEWMDQCVLVQVWAPVWKGDRFLLSTSEQPFVLDSHSYELLQYRTASSNYSFSVDESSGGTLGLPGRVFKRKLPEWTPNVQYYSTKEYPRLTHALLYNLRGSLALPVFEPSGQSCVGVVELIMTSQKVNYSPEVDKMCRALEAVNLKSCEILEPQTIPARLQSNNAGHQAALAEIRKILTLACESHNLPLAQTWVPCRHCGFLLELNGSTNRFSISNPSGNVRVCLSLTDAAFYAGDAQMQGFRDACSEHHILRDQGVVGRAFSRRRPCFCGDITKFFKDEYPLVHYAQMFGLSSCLALCFRNARSEDDEDDVYVAEFFLPTGCREPNEQHALMESILTLVWQSFTTAAAHCYPLQTVDLITYSPMNMILEEQHSVPLDDSGKNAKKATGNAPIPAQTVRMNKVWEKKRGKAERVISLEVLQQYFSGNLIVAAKKLGVCPTTLKHICRRHGISRWPSRKINKVNSSLSKLKEVIEASQEAKLALILNPLVCRLPDAAGSMLLPTHFNVDSMAEDPKASDSGKFQTSSEGAMETQTHASLGSCHGSPGHEGFDDHPVSAYNVFENQNTAPLFTMDDTRMAESAADALTDDSTSLILARNPSSNFITKQKLLIVKASYKEDIIRFRLASDAGIVALRAEVGKRLGLGASEFGIKYLDEDHDWIMLACDEDFEECIEIFAVSEPPVIRLLVHNDEPNLGSSDKFVAQVNVILRSSSTAKRLPHSEHGWRPLLGA